MSAITSTPRNIATAAVATQSTTSSADDKISASAGTADIEKPDAKQPLQSFSVDPTDTLAVFDRHHTGKVSIDDIKIAVHQSRMMRKFIAILVILVFVVLAGMCFATYVAVTMATEMHVHHSALVDGEGKSISTMQRFDVIHGVHVADERRLDRVNMTAADGTGVFSLTTSSFQTTRDSYVSGKVDWIVDLPDATTRTVHIQGMANTTAWGLCGSCDGNLVWEVTCTSDSGDCAINWDSIETSRRQLSHDETKPASKNFLARAERAGGSGAELVGGDAAVTGSLERALTTKCLQ